MKNWVLSFMVLTGIVTHVHAENNNTFRFREPHPAKYRIHEKELRGKKQWINAVSATDPTLEVQTGSRIILQVKEPAFLNDVIGRRPISVARKISDTVVILEAADAKTALEQAEAISQLPGVETCHPVMRRTLSLDAPYAPLPTDPYFSSYQGYFEWRQWDGTTVAPTLNIRSAWPHTRGTGVTVAIADTGFELDHPELQTAALNSPHFNFETGTPNGAPPALSSIHGTAVAGLVAAANNGF
ncbi:MAG: S8 family serine peptidase, partial [Limisphaerales bacterium]